MFHAKSLLFRAERLLDNAVEILFVPARVDMTERQRASRGCPAALRELAGDRAMRQQPGGFLQVAGEMVSSCCLP
jgi:hypothetical protein